MPSRHFHPKGPPSAPVVGTAGWSIPRAVSDQFPAEGSSLERYAARFAGVEINSSFHRPHRLTTWARWRDAVPENFRFSVKLPKLVTHKHKLIGCEAALDDFMPQVGALGDKLAVLLVQLPPSLAFDEQAAAAFFADLGTRTHASIVCEPRHRTWFTSTVDQFLVALEVSRVAADPAICPEAASPGGWPGLAYWRLHGSPAMYRSSYADRLDGYAALVGESGSTRETWCIFDNTASSSALPDALDLQQCLDERARRPA